MRRKLLGFSAIGVLALVLVGTLLVAGFQPAPDAGRGESAAHIQAFETERELRRQEVATLQTRRQIVSEKFDIMGRRFGLLEDDLLRADRQFALDVDRALSLAHQRAEQLLQGQDEYNRAEARHLATSRYATQTAGHLGAIGAQPLPQPQRDPGYADDLHRRAKDYSDALRTFKLDTDSARLALDREIGRVVSEFLSLHTDITALETEGVDIGDRERAACEKAITLAKSLTPFMTRNDLPSVPPESANPVAPSLREQLSASADRVRHARVCSDSILSRKVNAEFSSPTFKRADSLVKQLTKRGLP